MPSRDDGAEPRHLMLDRTDTDPTYEIVDAIASFEGLDPDELPSFYDTVDHLVEHVFTNPPKPEAQIRLEFTYAGYRITLEQDGSAVFLKIV